MTGVQTCALPIYTLLAINIAGINFDQFYFVSTAGGAFLEALEDKVLPGVEALNLG